MLLDIPMLLPGVLCDNVLYLVRLVRHCPDWFLDELLPLRFRTLYNYPP